MDLTNPANLLIAGIYFVIVGLMSVFSFFGVYVLVKNGQSKVLSIVVALFFCVIFLSLLSQSYNTLSRIIQA